MIGHYCTAVRLRSEENINARMKKRFLKGEGVKNTTSLDHISSQNIGL
jgi:hypothetical protein